jgi:hypothetical protein
MTTKDERNELMKIFKSLDKNGDGRLTKEELQDGYNKSLAISDNEIDELMKKLDNDGSGYIDYTGKVRVTKNSLPLRWIRKRYSRSKEFRTVSSCLTRIRVGKYQRPNSSPCLAVETTLLKRSGSNSSKKSMGMEMEKLALMSSERCLSSLFNFYFSPLRLLMAVVTYLGSWMSSGPFVCT